MDDGARMRTAASIPVPEAIEIDADISNQPVGGGNEPSPAKRSRWDEGPTSAGVSLADLMAALAPLTMGMQTMQQGLKNMQSRMTAVEGHVTTKVSETLDMIRAVDVRHKAQSSQLKDIQTHIGESRTREKEILQRVDLLEDGQAGARMWRQQAFDGEQGEGPTAPAVVLGGWDTELDEEEVIQKAHKLLKDLSLDLVTSRKHSCQGPRGGEDRTKLQRRTIQSVEIVRQAAYLSRAKDRKGQPAKSLA